MNQRSPRPTDPLWADVGPDPADDYHDLTVHALMVVGPGEADRWLDSVVRWTAPAVDSLFIYADMPDQATLDALIVLARPAPEGVAATVWCRSSDDPGFLDHEARFRAAAWAAWHACINPAPGDWVLLPDADEYLVCQQAALGRRDALHGTAGYAQQLGLDAAAVPIPEVWAFAPDRHPMVRVDGRWAGNSGPRLVRWQPTINAGDPRAWRDAAMGCGSAPACYTDPGHSYAPSFVRLLHYGYAHVADVAAKAARYQGMADHGHNDDHVASITRPPRLEPISGVGEWPDAYRGIPTPRPD